MELFDREPVEMLPTNDKRPMKRKKPLSFTGDEKRTEATYRIAETMTNIENFHALRSGESPHSISEISSNDCISQPSCPRKFAELQPACVDAEEGYCEPQVRTTDDTNKIDSRLSNGMSNVVNTSARQTCRTRSHSLAGAVVEPGINDILFGRGKHVRENPGNDFMRLVVDVHREVYEKADRDDKTEITRNIVRMVKSKGCRFLRLDKTKQSGWREASDEEARLKVGHAIRDGWKRPLGTIDPRLLDGIPSLSDDVKKSVAKMACWGQQDALESFEVEEAEILLELLDPYAQVSQNSDEGDQEKDRPYEDKKPPAF